MSLMRFRGGKENSGPDIRDVRTGALIVSVYIVLDIHPQAASMGQLARLDDIAPLTSWPSPSSYCSRVFRPGFRLCKGLY